MAGLAAGSLLKAETAQERVRLQKQGLTDALDEMVKTGINAVYFQVKPDGTALWRSNILPSQKS